MYRIAVCDDNEIFLNELSKALYDYFSDSEQLHTVVKYQGGLGLIHDIAENIRYDIFILDIVMPGYSGFDVVKAIQRVWDEPIIIFVTSYLKYAVESFDYNVFRFIPKLELRNRLPAALKAAFARLDKQRAQSYIVENRQRYVKLPFGEISYIYKEGKNSVFVLTDTVIKVRKTLGEIYGELNSEDFMFIDRCTIVNLQMIKGLDHKLMRILLKDGTAIAAAKIKLQDLRQKLNSYWYMGEFK